MIATGTRIIIRKEDADKQTASGIILRNPTERPRAHAVSVGPRVLSKIKRGDELIVDWSRVGRFEFLEQEYFIVDESDVWCVVE